MNKNKNLYTTIAVAALGYFVDIYDLLLFGIVRVQSLKAIGVPEDQIMSVGIWLINSQMIGLLLGGMIWGILGDKKGRVSVLFGSIFLYSVANIANAFVQTAEQYAFLRLIAGIGLAGELGAAITLVSEIMSKEKRGLGTTIVAAVGILGAVFAAIVADLFDWRVAYIIGGVMGLALLFLRVQMLESGLFSSVATAPHIPRGQFLRLFKNAEVFFKYLRCILIGVPIWFVIGILITFSPELAKALQVQGLVKASTAIMMAYIGLSAGDLASGLISQLLRSRKKALAIFMALSILGTLIYGRMHGVTPFQFYALCLFLGFAVGYWAVFVTVAAEQFGTNMRATVATTVPNFVRGAVVPLTVSFEYLSRQMLFSLYDSALIVGLVSFVLAGVALFCLEETFSKDLDYIEMI